MTVFEILIFVMFVILLVEHTYFNLWHYFRIKRQDKSSLDASKTAWEALRLLMDDFLERKKTKSGTDNDTR